MKVKFESQWVEDIEKENGCGWVFVDTVFPDPFYKPGYGDPITVLTKTKFFRKKPDVRAFKSVVQDLKTESIQTLKVVVSKLK